MQLWGLEREMVNIDKTHEEFFKQFRDNDFVGRDLTLECSYHGSFPFKNGVCTKCEEEQRKSIARTNVPPLYQNCRFNNFNVNQQNKEMYEKLEAYKIPDRNIVVLGTCGSGKTHLATSLVNEMRLRGSTAVYILFYDLADYKIHDRPMYDRIRNADFLVIDEIGVSDNDFKSNLLFEIINHRTNHLHYTMIVGNLKPEKFASFASDALKSRLKHKCLNISIEAEDYRLKENYDI